MLESPAQTGLFYLPSKSCGVVFSNGFRQAGLSLATAARPSKSRNSAMRHSVLTAHKKTFDINIMAMVVKTLRGTRTDRCRHGNVKIFFQIFFVRFIQRG
jgi:hypothetical protein